MRARARSASAHPPEVSRNSLRSRPAGSILDVPIMATPSSPPVNAPSASDLRAILARMKREQAKEGAPPFEKRLERLDQIERGVVERTQVLAAAVSRDFGGRSSRETM